MYRQTNHNGRVSKKSGAVYNPNHNDRNFDISRALNIHADMVDENIIIHYDANNQPHYIDYDDPNKESIREHEYKIYEELFGESINKQNERNIAARHPERNKSIEDLSFKKQDATRDMGEKLADNYVSVHRRGGR